MYEQVGGVEQAVLQLGKQLAAMNSVLQSLVPKTVDLREKTAETSTSQVVKSPTLAQAELQAQEAINEYLRKHLEMEREVTKQFEEARFQNLPPIRVGRTAAPPRFQTQDLTSEKGTPGRNQNRPNTPAFQQFQPNRERIMAGLLQNL